MIQLYLLSPEGCSPPPNTNKPLIQTKKMPKLPITML